MHFLSPKKGKYLIIFCCFLSLFLHLGNVFFWVNDVLSIREQSYKHFLAKAALLNSKLGSTICGCVGEW
jgi:hypothetical protein